jgi:hypothetical protein
MSAALTDLEDRLAAPGGAALRDELAGRVVALEARLRARIAAGLPREDFPAWQAAAEAAAAAREVLAGWPANADPDPDSAVSSNAPPPAAALPSLQNR